LHKEKKQVSPTATPQRRERGVKRDYQKIFSIKSETHGIKRIKGKAELNCNLREGSTKRVRTPMSKALEKARGITLT